MTPGNWRCNCTRCMWRRCPRRCCNRPQGLREAQDIALVHAAQIPRGDWAILVAGPQGTAPFGLGVPSRDGRATVIAHAPPAVGGWHALLVLTAEDIAEGGLVSLDVYATEAEAGGSDPSDQLMLSMPPRPEGEA